MNSILQTAEVIVCVGSGGVGKTTVASSLAFRAAELGRNVLVLTVDPAKRLKTTMGLSDTEDSVEIKHPRLRGTLHASVIDAKKTFDEFVTRASTNPERVKKILNNKLYVQLSTTLSGSQEFTALEKLYSSYESKKYDLIVLDTPPTKHAIDFLNAPQKLAQIFSEGIAKWFRDPKGEKQNFFVGILSQGTKQVLKALETLTGSEFMRELSEFFQNIEQWQGQLERRTGDVHRLLVSPKTDFVLVSSFDEAKLKEAEFFAREITKGGYHLSTLIINRAYPRWLNLNEPPKSQSLVPLYQRYLSFYKNREEIFKRFAIRMSKEGNIVRLPELSDDVSDLDGVETLAHELGQDRAGDGGAL